MQYRELGTTGIKTSALGYGCARLGSFLSSGNYKEIVDLLQKALSLGVTFYDTADIYGQGDSERLLGKAFKNKRDQVILETKAGFCFSQTAKAASRFKKPIRKIIKLFPSLKKKVLKARSASISQRFDAQYIENAAEQSLTRLDTDYIDVFMLHSPSIEELRKMDFLEGIDRLREKGKILSFGVACENAEVAKACLDIPNISVIQVPVNLNQELITESILPIANDKNIGVVARESFAGGKIFNSEENNNNSALPEHLIKKQALDFALSHPAVGVTIVGMSSKKHLLENVKLISDNI